jgi:hypothetical protein
MGKWIAALFFMSIAVARAAPEDDLAAMAKALPHDVRVFIARKSECNHWAGEEPYDAARGKEIERAVARLKCGALDKDEAAIKRRYSRNATIRKALALAGTIYQ